MKNYSFVFFILTLWLIMYGIQTHIRINPQPIYALTTEVDTALESITPITQPLSNANAYRKQYAEVKPNPQRKKQYQKPIIDVNTSDTLQFQKLSGIGSYRAKRIVIFREALGGFSSIQQVSETYGLPDSIFQSILPQLQITGAVKKIQINQTSYDSLYLHPYITKQMAYYISKSKREQGSIQNFEQLQKILSAHHQNMLSKLKPYLDYSIYTN